MYNMNKLTLYAALATILIFGTGCEAIGGIFKAGVWAGVLLVVVVIALIIFVISKVTGGKK